MGKPLSNITCCRLVMQERVGTKSPSRAGFCDGEGGLFRVMTVTFHFENGTWYSERTLPDTWNGEDVWEETDTDYDPNFNGGENGEGYGDPVDPDTNLPTLGLYESYAFSNIITEGDLTAQVEGMPATWGDFGTIADIGTVFPGEAHGHDDGVTINKRSGVTSYTTSKSVGAKTTLGGWAADVVLLQVRFLNHSPMSAKVRYTSSPQGLITQTLTAGGELLATDPGVAVDEHHDVHLSAIQWLPWAS